MAVRQFRGRKIRDLLRSNEDYSRYTVNEKTPLTEVSEKLAENPSHIVVVINDDNRPQGLVTQTDLMKIFKSGKPFDPSTEVEEFMNRDVIRIHEERTVDDALSLMNSLNVNKLVVLDNDGKFKGFLHKLDIIREARELL